MSRPPRSVRPPAAQRRLRQRPSPDRCVLCTRQIAREPATHSPCSAPCRRRSRSNCYARSPLSRFGLTVASEAEPCAAGGTVWRPAASMNRSCCRQRGSSLWPVLHGLLADRLSIELVELLYELIGHQLADVHLGAEARGLALHRRSHKIL